MIRNAKADRNQPEIVAVLRKLGAAVLITSQLKNAFDILVAHKGRLFVVEIKDGDLSPSKKKLTEGEQKCKRLFESAGVKYHVIESIEEAIALIS